MELELLDPKKEFKINEYFRAVLYNSSIRIKFLKEINLARNRSHNISNNLIDIKKKLKQKGVIINYGRWNPVF